jgi:hypothetical protein
LFKGPPLRLFDGEKASEFMADLERKAIADGLEYIEERSLPLKSTYKGK